MIGKLSVNSSISEHGVENSRTPYGKWLIDSGGKHRVFHEDASQGEPVSVCHVPSSVRAASSSAAQVAACT